MTSRFLLRLGIAILFALGRSYCNIFETVSELRELECIYKPHTTQYVKSAVLANYACSHMCPQLVALPKTVEQVSRIVQICNQYNISLSIRGGGHGYTCQATKDGGLMMDLRGLDRIEVDEKDLHMAVGGGVVWSDVLPLLKKKGLSAVHGQCTSVGVAGYSLHGGVHFGGLSELYGLASDNIMSVTAVIANSSIVTIADNFCLMDSVEVADFQECEGLWRSIRGAASSFAVVTDLKIRLHRLPDSFRSSLSVVRVRYSSVNAHGDSLKDNDKIFSSLSEQVDSFMKSIPSDVSLTLFGLDSFYKAFMFVLKFTTGLSRKTVFRDGIRHLLSREDKNSFYFVVEASWINKSNGDGSDEVLKNLFDISNNLNRDYNDFDVVTLNMPIKFVLTTEMWSVPSYDLVWGSGHSYGEIY